VKLDNVAVLTGDIVGSTKMSRDDLERVFTALGEVAEDLRSHFDAPPPPLHRHRGDGWQFLWPAPHQALRICLQFRASVIALGVKADTRIAVGFGAVAHLAEGDLGTSDGPAFRLSGRRLESLAAPHRLDVVCEESELDELRAAFALADFICQSWTTKRAEAMRLYLAEPGRTQAEIGSELGISQQSAHERLNGAGAFHLHKAIEALES